MKELRISQTTIAKHPKDYVQVILANRGVRKYS